MRPILEIHDSSIFCLPSNSSEIQELMKYVEFTQIDSPENIYRDLATLTQSVSLGHAYTSSG